MKKISIIYLILPVLLVCCLAACSEKESPAVPAIELQGGNTLNMEAGGGTLNLVFNSTFPWTATSDEDWCVLGMKSGEGGGITLPIEVRPNETFKSRSAFITLRSETLFCRVEVVQAEHGAVTLVVKHTLPKFTLPEFAGTEIQGSVQWGDGKQEDYKDGLSHDFEDHQKEHSTSIVVKGVEKVTLNSILGITEIDFSAF